MTSENPELSARRPLATRGKSWVKAFTRFLLKTKVTPNQVSVMSFLFALIGAGALYFTAHHNILWVVAAICIQLRLICNLMDGLLAVEGKLSSYNGDLYNEIPDRLSDVILLIGAGYAAQCQMGAQLGWLAATGALMTSYIRMHGASLTQGDHDFSGPMAKPQRMAILTAACLLSPLTVSFLPQVNLILVAVIVIAAGSYITFVSRIFRLNRKLKSHS